MACTITLEALLRGCADDSFDDGIRIDTELEPLSGAGGLVKPAVYEGGTYQTDRRWAKPDDDEPTLLHGFSQAHLSNKGPFTKHVRACVLETLGMSPVMTETANGDWP